MSAPVQAAFVWPDAPPPEPPARFVWGCCRNCHICWMVDGTAGPGKLPRRCGACNTPTPEWYLSCPVGGWPPRPVYRMTLQEYAGHGRGDEDA